MLSSFLQKLMFVNQFSIAKGKIEILKDNYIMLNARSILVLQEIDQSKVYNAGKKSSEQDIHKLVKHAQVYKNIKNQELKNIATLSKKIGKTDEGTIKTLETIFEIYGLGKLEIINLDNENSKATLRIRNSTIALAQPKKTSTPSCSLTAGILAGIFSYIFDKDVDCIENKCIAKKDQSCEFLIK